MGTRSVTATVTGLLSATNTNLLDASSTGTGSITCGETVSATFTSGTGASAVNRALSDRGRAILSAASLTVDLYDLGTLDVGAGAGVDGLGQTFALSGIKALFIYNDSASAGNLVVGNDGTTAAWNSFFSASDTASFTLVPGASVLICDPSAAGMAVADTSNHLLKFAASGGDVTFHWHMLGRTA